MPDQLDDASRGDDPDGLRELEWTFVRSLLSASAYENRALESFFLQRYSRDGGGDADLDAVRQYLDDALAQHRRAVEDLEHARRALADDDAVGSDEETAEYP